MSADPASVTEVVRLRPGVFRARADAGGTYLLTHCAGEPVGALDDAEVALLDRLAAGPVAPETVDSGGRPLLAALHAGGWLAVTRSHRQRPAYTVVPHRRPPPAAAPVPDGAVLSRFTVLRRDSDDYLLEHPDAWCRVRLHDAALLPAVEAAESPTGGCPQTPEPVLWARLRQDLWHAGLLVVPGSAEDTEFERRQWSPYERWLHHSSRIGDHHLALDRFARTGWAREEYAPLPARHPPYPGSGIDLYRPDLATLSRTDPPLTEVLERRRSVREHDDSAPITADQLGELLYRCVRNRQWWTGDGMEQLSRPYPSGGSLHELEVYPVVRHAAGLDPGLYHYDPQDHRLTPVCGPDQRVRRLLAAAARAAGTPAPPQVLLVVAARFGRLMGKYEQIGYTLVLKHVGVLYQTVYSVATAMGLAVCGLGTGDADAFTAATGLDPWQESSVGELMLGSRGEDRRADGRG